MTGAAKRLGREIALEFARQGWDVAVHYGSSATEAQATAAEIKQLGRKAEVFQADLAKDVEVMIIAIIISIGIMMLAAKSISDFVESHPTIKMLALSFLILVGVTLLAEGAGYEIPRGYIYFAMAFSVTVEMLNIRLRAKSAKPLHLHKTMNIDGENA